MKGRLLGGHGSTLHSSLMCPLPPRTIDTGGRISSLPTDYPKRLVERLRPLRPKYRDTAPGLTVTCAR